MHWRVVLALWLGLGLPSELAAEADPGVEPARAAVLGRGLKVLHMQGCTACHSLDGRSGVGPTLAGRLGAKTRVREGERLRTLSFDADYLARSLRAPDEAVAEGFPAGVMPRYALTDEQLEAVQTALAALPAGEPARTLADYALPALSLLALVGLGLFGLRATRGR